MTIYKIHDLSFSYKKSKQIFRNTNLELESNKITLLSGANGSGKTTFCRLLSGLQKGFKGSILLKESDINNLSISEIAKNIVFIKQEPLANVVASTADEDLSIWQNKFSSLETKEIKKLRDKALSRFELQSIKNKPVWELSSGEIKRIGLSAMLLSYDKYWILDEPTTNLDEKSVNKFIEIVAQRKREGFGALIVSQRIEKFKSLVDSRLHIENKKIIIVQ
ncbi:MAG: ABC transporter ATP-binding protein [Candidatus Cloacimonetes bacterium]|nr:ABC transporter ATP-binding protein [Candidatus Cloacimonadota bacterium]